MRPAGIAELEELLLKNVPEGIAELEELAGPEAIAELNLIATAYKLRSTTACRACQKLSPQRLAEHGGITALSLRTLLKLQTADALLLFQTADRKTVFFRGANKYNVIVYYV